MSIKRKEIKKMTDKITQNTEAWLEAKQSKIGGSEIFTLVLEYCKEELKQANINIESETAFSTPLELFLKVKYDIQEKYISNVNSEFGLGLEQYLEYRLQNDLKFTQTDVRASKDFVVREDMHKLASCSPDGFIEVRDGELETFDKNGIIDKSWGQGLIEFKTSRWDFYKEAESGAKLSYIFQI